MRTGFALFAISAMMVAIPAKAELLQVDLSIFGMD